MLRVNNLIGFGKRSASSGGTNAVSYNGTNAYLSRASDFTGDADSSQGVLSIWIRLDAVPGTNFIFSNEAETMVLNNQASGKLRFRVTDSAAASKSLTFDANTGYTTQGTWRNILASWNTNFSAGNKLKQIYINGSSDLGTVTDASTAFTIDYTRAGWAVAARFDDPTNLFQGSIAEMFFAPGHYLDFSVSANRDIFYNSATGKPANVGNLPAAAGFSPILYLTNPASTVNVNSGTGGNMTINGTPTVASNSPSS